MQQSLSTQIFFEEEFQVLQQNTIKRITSSTLSENRRQMLVTTGKGFVICDLGTMKYVRYEDEASPFYKKPKEEAVEKKVTPYGCKLGSILETRAQVALIPNFSSQFFKETCVYIYDYSIRIILTKFNFNLPINLFSITNSHLIISNNKRIVLYNYLKGQPAETQQYYLQTFKSHQNADFIHYLELFCHQCDDQHYSLCECGRYVYSKKGQYMKMVYMRIGSAQNKFSRILYLYDQKYGSSNYFYEQKPYHQNFQFSITQDGKYLAISQGQGTKINIYNLDKNCLYSVLYLAMSAKSIINLDVMTLPDGSEWVMASRSKQGVEATMHMFTLNQTSITEQVKSIYKRKFKLYKKTMRDYQVFQDIDNFIPPVIFMHGYKLYALSLVGEYCELIDFDRSGLHKEGTVNDYRSIEPQTAGKQ